MVLWNPKGQSRRNLTLPSTFCGLGQVSPLVILSQKKKKLFLSKTSSFLFWVMHFRILVNSCCSWEREPQVCPPGTAVIICNASSSQGRYQPGVCCAREKNTRIRFSWKGKCSSCPIHYQVACSCDLSTICDRRP